MMKNFKFFALASVALFAACSNEENPVVDQTESTLALRLETPALSRAIEDPIADQTAVVFKDVTLYFWTDANKTVAASSPKLVLTAQQIAAAKTNEGALIKMPSNATHVSMTANNSVDASSIVNYQELGSEFTTKVPLTSPAVAPTTHSTKPNAKQVTLVPVLDMARLEVTGKVTPTENPKAPEVNGKRSAYESVKIEAVYLNNYKLTAAVTGLTKYTQADWSSYPAKMHDVLTDENREALANKTKASAFQVFPSKYTEGQDNMNHIVLKVSYKLNKANAAEVKDRWITIKNFKEGNNYTNFDAGTIYKLDLSSLNDKFGTDDSGNPTDPTDDKPELDKTDLYLTITAVKWTSKNITPDI